MKFTTINQWINEQVKEDKTFGCIMLDTKFTEWEDFHTSGIDPKDIYIKSYDESYGVEDNPHMTLLYGIHEDEIAPEIIMSIIEKDLEPVTVEITKISIFENEEYDVVKYDIPVTDQIQKYRDMLEKTLPNTQTYPDFHPHMTLAYVKPGEGSKYVKELDEPFSVTFNKGVYSFHEANDEGEIEEIRKEFVFPDEDRMPVDLNNTDSIETTSPFTSDNE